MTFDAVECVVEAIHRVGDANADDLAVEASIVILKCAQGGLDYVSMSSRVIKAHGR